MKYSNCPAIKTNIYLSNQVLCWKSLIEFEILNDPIKNSFSMLFIFKNFLSSTKPLEVFISEIIAQEKNGP